MTETICPPVRQATDAERRLLLEKALRCERPCGCGGMLDLGEFHAQDFGAFVIISGDFKCQCGEAHRLTKRF